jgi:phosphate:Na+ symporter
MQFLEDSLRVIAGRPFKLFLKKHSEKKLKAIAGGAAITAILQSSSLVSLIVLAFVSTHVIQSRNAFALVLGANLGSTMTSWIIVLAGFRLNIENIFLPLAGISGIGLVLLKKDDRWFQWAQMLFGMALLFIGLDHIRLGVGSLLQGNNVTFLSQQSLAVFFLIGFLVTALVQSSSVTVAIALSALNTNAISLYAAAALVLGAEVGTTIKLILPALKGPAAAKQLATGTVSFNLASSLIALIFLFPIMNLIHGSMGIRDNLLALVFFQTFVNLAGIMLAYPFINSFAKLLEKLFHKTNGRNQYLHKVAIADGGLAIEALEKETRNLIGHAIGFMANTLHVKYTVPASLGHGNFQTRHISEKYEYIKQLHGEILNFCVSLQRQALRQDDAIRLQQLIAASRNAMYAAKSTRDIIRDVTQLHNSSNDVKYHFYEHARDQAAGFCKTVNTLNTAENESGQFTMVADIYKSIQNEYTASLQELYKEGVAKRLDHSEISTLINFNRELHTAFKSIVFALKDLLLCHAEAEQFDQLPGFIR